jgi:hypothetical protein
MEGYYQQSAGEFVGNLNKSSYEAVKFTHQIPCDCFGHAEDAD